MNKHNIKKKQRRNAVTKRKKQERRYKSIECNPMTWMKASNSTSIYIYIYYIYIYYVYIYIVLTHNSSPPFFPSKRCHDSIFTYNDSGVGRYPIYTFGRHPSKPWKIPRRRPTTVGMGGKTWVNTGDFNYQLQFAGVPDTPEKINESIVSRGK